MDVKDIVDEAILESHLFGLTEDEIWADLEYFAKCCERVVRQRVKDDRALAELLEKLSQVKTCTLVSETSIAPDRPFRANGSLKSPRERFPQRAARNKRVMLKAMEDCDPRMIPLVQKELYRSSPKRPRQRKPLSHGARILVLRIAYVALVVCLFLLVYLIIIARP